MHLREEGCQMHIKNFMEDAVMHQLDGVLAKYPDICHCEQCKSDIAALALNQLPPKYVSTERGEIFSRVGEMETQNSVEILQAILKAIAVVRAHPRHDHQKA